MRVVCYLIIFFSFQYSLAQNIIKAEYFFDQDPGVGNGTFIDFSPIGNEVEQSFEDIDISFLPTGFHTLVVRVLNDEGVWSLSMSKNFYVNPIIESGQKVINQLAYFIDNNFNDLTYIDVSPSANVEETIEINVNEHSTGSHRLNVLSKSSNGEWSLYKQKRFFVFEKVTPPSVVPVKKIEYFFNDDDSGIGNATNIEFTIENDVAIGKDSVLLEEIGLEQGRHTIKARVQDELGRWSLTSYLPFDLCLEEGVDVGQFEVEIQRRVVSLTDNSLYAEDYEWNMGNNVIITDPEFDYEYPSGGEYTIKQTVSNFCDEESFSRTIIIEATKIIGEIPTLTIDEDSDTEVLVEDLNTIFEPFNENEELTFIIIDDPQSVFLDITLNEDHSVHVKPIPNAFGLRNSVVIGAVDQNENPDTVSVKVSVLINEINDRPSLKSTFNDISVCEDCGPFLITNRVDTFFTDVDGDTLAFTATSNEIIPEIINNRILQVSLPENYNGDALVIVSASDGELSVSDQFSVNVSQVPDPISIISPISDKSINEDETLNLGHINEVFFSVDGDNLNYNFFTSNDNVQTILNGTEMIIIPDENYFGEATISLFASLGSESALEQFKLTIKSVNDPPVLSNLSDISFCPSNPNPETLFFASSVSDPDHDISEMFFSYEVLSTSREEVDKSELSIVIDNEQAIANLSSESHDSVTYEVKFTVLDLANESSSDTVLISLSGISYEQDGDLLTATNADSYQWYRNSIAINEATNQTYEIRRDGTYHVTAVVNGCQVVSRAKFLGITSLEESLLDISTNIFPNPTFGNIKVIIDNNEIAGDLEFNLYTKEGKLVKSQTFTKNHKLFEREIHLDNFASGMYVLEITSQNSKILKYILKQ